MQNYRNLTRYLSIRRSQLYSVLAQRNVRILALVCVLTSCTYAEPKMVFDIPRLVNKNIDEIKKIMGEPMSDYESEGGSSRYASYYNGKDDDTVHLWMRYSPASREIDFLMIITRKPYRTIEDLMIVGNLKSKSNQYKVKTDTTFSLYENGYQQITVYPLRTGP